MTNSKLKSMAIIALDNWLFDSDTDPHGDVRRGLDYILEDGDFDEDVITENVKSSEDWDGLQDWATRLGQYD